MKMNFKHTYNHRLLYFTVVSTLFLLVSCGKSKSYKVDYGYTTKGDIIEKVSVSGKIHPEIEVKISPDVSGEIIELNVEEGDSVSAGMLLLKIKPDNYKSLYDMSVASVNSSRAALAQAQSRLSQAKANHIKTELEYNRTKKLLDQKVVSQSDFETVEAQFKVSLEEIASAKQSIRSAEFNIQSSVAQMNDAQENLNKTTIYAPSSGVVSKLNVEKGERVVGTSQMAGTELMRIANLRNMEIRVDVNENDIVRVSKGDTAIIEVDSYSDKVFKGVVTAIANTAKDAVNIESVTEFEVKVRILASSYKSLIKEGQNTYPFRPGMTASVDIITNVQKAIMKVPLAAVTTREKGDTTNEVVFVIEDNMVREQKVVTGISDFDFLEVKSGMVDSQMVVTGSYKYVSRVLKDGDRVELKEKGDDKEETSVGFSFGK